MKYLWKLLLVSFLILFWGRAKGQSLEDLINNSSNPEAFWSITVLDEKGEVLESINSNKLIIPASNQKLYTLGAVLDRLRRDFRYETNIYTDGEIIDSVLNGDLIIQGVGDPSISGFLYNDDRYFVFKNFLKQLREKGISNIQGSIMGDASYFDQQVYPKGWDWYDLSFYYGVEIGPLSFNNNAVDIIVMADSAIGKRPRVESFPNTWPVVTSEEFPIDIYLRPVINLINDQEIVKAGMEYDEYYRRELGTNRITLASKLPFGYIEKESLSIQHADFFFLESFNAFLKLNGIKFKDNLRSSSVIIEDGLKYSEFKIVAKHTSKPLSELIEWTNKESDNFYTEMLLKTLSAETRGIPGTFENGIKEVKSFLAEQNVDTNLVKMNDGSGLATGNFTTTRNLSNYLFSMRSHNESEVFISSLPVAGIDGSIAHRFKGTHLYNNLKAKTGYVGGSRTLSGYFESASGRTLTFSIATNHFAGKVRPVDNFHQQILEFLYQKY